MMYPLNVTNAELGGYAVANSEAEHKALTEAGYLPALEKQDGRTIESVREELDAKGIDYNKRWGLAKLLALTE